MIEGHVIRGDTVDDLKVALADLDELIPEHSDGWVWFDVVDPTVVDARHRGQAPKAEMFGDHIFVVLRPLSTLGSAFGLFAWFKWKKRWL